MDKHINKINNEYKKYENVEEGKMEKAMNVFLKKKEVIESKTHALDDNYYMLYPSYNDPNFNVKISQKKEFYDTKYNGSIEDATKQGDIICNAKFELNTHQIFVRNFLSSQTPYNSLLLYHGLGTGKTCSAITIAEEMRDYMNQMNITQRIIVVASPNVQENFKLQLFDERKLKYINNEWNLNSCTGNKFINEINPIKINKIVNKNIENEKKRIIKQVNKIINSAYLFMGYVEFSNFIKKKSTIDANISDKKKAKLKKKRLNKFFNNRLIIIDEVHNIRVSEDNNNKKVAKELYNLVTNVDNMRLLLLSATPMYNNYKEIIWLINLMNINDNRFTIDIKDIFDKKGNFKVVGGKEVGKELFLRKCRGYVSFLRGGNPYTFPYRIYPKIFSPENSFLNYNYPRLQMNKKEIIQPIKHIDVFLNKIGSYQKKVYNYILKQIGKKINNKSNQKLLSFENMNTFGYSLLQRPLEALNIVYPNSQFDKLKDTSKTKFDISKLVGKRGLNNIVSYEESGQPIVKKNYTYKKGHEGFFSKNEIHKYSTKIMSICNQIANSKGVVLIYSQYIDGGLVPMALALEELGFSRYGRTSLFKDKQHEPIDATTLLPRIEFKKQYPNKKFKQAKYSMITGNLGFSPNNIDEIKKITNETNKNGEDIKVVMISMAGAEGLDFTNIRQLHILEPWYNMNRIEQIIGRAIRNCSHKLLPFEERNTLLYLHATLLEEEIESVDLYVYRVAENKALQIGKISRVLKQNAVDCILNSGQNNFTVEKMNQKIIQRLSNNKTIQYDVGVKPYTSECDYLESCVYSCIPDKKLNDMNVDMSSYNEQYIIMNVDKIIRIIKQLMKEKYIYTKEELSTEINLIKEYPDIQINYALTELLEDKNQTIYDMYDRPGNLINIGKLYIYQPNELNNKTIPMFERRTPILYKNNTIKYKIPTKIKGVKKGNNIMKKERIINQNNIMNDINQKIYISKELNKIKRGDKNIYNYFGFVRERLNKNYNISHVIIDKLLLEKIIDNLLFKERIDLFHYIYYEKKDNLDGNELKVKDILDEKIISFKDGNVIVEAVYTEKKNKGVLMLFDKNDIVEGTNEDINDFKNVIETLKPDKNLFNQYLGFTYNVRNNIMVFKLKNLGEKRNKGARCDQSGKDESIKKYNKIVNKLHYNSDNTRNISQIEICIEQEFILRFWQHVRKEGKIWYLSNDKAIFM